MWFMFVDAGGVVSEGFAVVHIIDMGSPMSTSSQHPQGTSKMLYASLLTSQYCCIDLLRAPASSIICTKSAITIKINYVSCFVTCTYCIDLE